MIKDPPLSKKLPLGIQSFRDIREGDYYYVDKTPIALKLVEQGKHYFLSRPRRFGKSLLLDTLKELFEGNQTLFTGLYAETNWDWSRPYPVIKLDLGIKECHSLQELDGMLDQQLAEYEVLLGITPRSAEHDLRFRVLIQELNRQKAERVVVLIDEYDKPILDNLTQPDIAREMRDALRSLFVGLKSLDGILAFSFVTGVSKFSKVSLFSGLNHLRDITLSAEYSSICGYTDEDVDRVFAPELVGLDRQKIRTWYNGYNWTGTAVYNPFDLLRLFQERIFQAFWFETGTPKFLIDTLEQRQFFAPDLTILQSDEALISRFDVGDISTEALLWQAGYLTIKEVMDIGFGPPMYRLGFPNLEVEAALNTALLQMYGVQSQAAMQSRTHLWQALNAHDTEQLRASIHRTFASIPHDWYRNNPMAGYEGHYACVFYTQLAALGLNVQGEDVTNHGQIDLSLKFGNQVYLFEFKVVETEAEGKALQQLRDKAYADKFRESGVKIALIGVEFSKTSRNIVSWDVELLT